MRLYHPTPVAHECILPHKMRPSHHRLYDWFVRKTIKNATIVCSVRPSVGPKDSPASRILASLMVATSADDNSSSSI